MEDQPESARVEFLMAAAGPAASFVLALFLYVANAAIQWPAPIAAVISYLTSLNALLAAFNLGPAFPLDGGRILRAALWGWKDNLRWATKISSQTGSIFSIALILWGGWSNFVGGLHRWIMARHDRHVPEARSRYVLSAGDRKPRPAGRADKPFHASKSNDSAAVLDSAGQDSLDITSAGVLKGLVEELEGQGIEIYAAEVHAPEREFSRRTGLFEVIGEDHIFPTVDAAVRFIEVSAQSEKADPNV